MELIVKSLANLSINDEMLSKFDMQALLKNLKIDFDKLDNLKEAREKHEERNFLSRWWNSDELENAQLDSVELQASFSKKLGQLMIASVAQSQMLNQQQSKLQKQQNEIKQQTTDIADANETIKNQQIKLGEQQTELEKLIRDYFELKGLTADGAKKLIEVATDVQAAKQSMMEKFHNQHETVVELQREIREVLARQKEDYQKLKLEHEALLDKKLVSIDETFLSHKNEMSRQLVVIQGQLEQQKVEGKRVESSLKKQLMYLWWLTGTGVSITLGLSGFLAWENKALFGL